MRHFGGRVLSLEADPAKVEAWRRNVAEAGLEETCELVDGRRVRRRCREIEDVFDIVFIDAEKDDYERLFELARDKVEPGGLFVADNVLSHAETLAAYSKARQADPTLESVTVPLDRGLELSVVLTDLVHRHESRCRGQPVPDRLVSGTVDRPVTGTGHGGVAYVLSERLQSGQPRKGGGPA